MFRERSRSRSIWSLSAQCRRRPEPACRRRWRGRGIAATSALAAQQKQSRQDNSDTLFVTIAIFHVWCSRFSLYSAGPTTGTPVPAANTQAESVSFPQTGRGAFPLAALRGQSAPSLPAAGSRCFPSAEHFANFPRQGLHRERLLQESPPRGQWFFPKDCVTRVT